MRTANDVVDYERQRGTQEGRSLSRKTGDRRAGEDREGSTMNIKKQHRSRKVAIGITCTAAFALLAGTATAGIVSSLGVASRTVSGKPSKIVVDRRGDTIYELGGESLAHLKCVNWK